MTDAKASISWPNLRLLWGFVRPHRRKLIAGMILGLLVTATALATPMVTKAVFDALANGEGFGDLLVVLIVLLLASSVAGFVQWVLLGKLAEQIVFDARESMVRKYFRATLGSLGHRSSGELVTRVTSDTMLLREAASSSLVQLVNSCVAVVGTLVMMAVLDVVLLGSMLLALVIIGALVGILMPPIAKAKKQAQESVGKLGGILEGALRAIRTVKSSRAETRETERIISEARQSAGHSVRAVRTEAIAWTVAEGGIQVAIIGILGVGAYRVSIDALAVSSLIAFLLYVFNLIDPVSTLTMNVTQLQSGIAAAARIREVESLETEKHDSDDGEGGAATVRGRHRQTPPVLEFDDVTARYSPEGAMAVRGVTLEIPARGHTAIVGPSGAGKTSLFTLALRFLNPESGELLLDGTPYSELTIDQVRSRMAYVEQETPVVPGTVRDNLWFTHPEASEDEVWAALRTVHLDEAVKGLEQGLDTELSSTRVSGGQRQRIALARAIVRRPDILLLDEATAQVDGRTEAAIHDAIRSIAAERAVVTIAHRLSTIIDADMILVMDAGHLRACGTHDELLATDSLYRELIEALKISSPPADDVTPDDDVIPADDVVPA